MTGKIFIAQLLILSLSWFLLGATAQAQQSQPKEQKQHVQKILFNHFDIVIGGGSLSALAAAITAANVTIHRHLHSKKQHSSPLRIALIEPTDWAGGQLTSSNVPPDFGSENHVPENLPQSFVQFLMAVAGPDWLSNPGECWVSYKCFEAQRAASYIKTWLESYETVLTVFYNTVIIDSKIKNGKMTEIVAVHRSTGDPGEHNDNENSGYQHRLSEDLADWYSTEPSRTFPKKEILYFMNPTVVIEGTEFADLLWTSRETIPMHQGVETPHEESDQTDPACGQSTVLPFHISYHPAYNKSTEEDAQYPHPSTTVTGEYTLGGLTWNDVWTYRRVYGTGSNSSIEVNPNEVSNQNLDNDYKDGYLFVDPNKADSLHKEGFGPMGVNLTVLRAVEDRAYGWYDYLLSTSTDSITPGMSSLYLSLNQTQVGTKHGLAKVPYLRDTRRLSRGLEDFRLLYSHLSVASSDNVTAVPFPDTIGIGVYHYADIHGLHSNVCTYPDYITCCTHPVLPYYLPFRAMASEKVENLIFSGKTMAQSFLANAATRLHPVEWSSGVAAGAAAVGLASQQMAWTSVRGVYQKHIEDLQSLLRSPEVGSPLKWTL